MPDSTPPAPFRTYLFKSESIPRSKWYLKHKRPLLDKEVNRHNPGHDERESFYYPNPQLISSLFEDVLNKGYTGIRIYFGSCRTEIPAACDPSDKGRIVLIYVPTVEWDVTSGRYMDSNVYYMLNAKRDTPVTLSPPEFEQLICNYAEDKSSVLRGTLNRSDRSHPIKGKETISVFGGKDVIEEIKEEINYQLEMPNHGVSGIKIYINSYTNKPVRRNGHSLSQRLTIHFVFTDHAGQDLDLLYIDERYKDLTAPSFVAYNTFNPTPPYP
jgi:hypothetical protein